MAFDNPQELANNILIDLYKLDNCIMKDGIKNVNVNESDELI
jgi:hypothetical protein